MSKDISQKLIQMQRILIDDQNTHIIWLETLVDELKRDIDRALRGIKVSSRYNEVIQTEDSFTHHKTVISQYIAKYENQLAVGSCDKKLQTK